MRCRAPTASCQVRTSISAPHISARNVVEKQQRLPRIMANHGRSFYFQGCVLLDSLDAVML